MTILDTLTIYARTCQSRALRRFLRFAVRNAINDNPSACLPSSHEARGGAGEGVKTLPGLSDNIGNDEV